MTYQDEPQENIAPVPAPPRSGWPVIAGVLLAIAILLGVFSYMQSSRAAAEQKTLSANLAAVQQQLQDVSEQLKATTRREPLLVSGIDQPEARAAARPSPLPAPAPRRVTPAEARPRPAVSAADAKRLERIESRLNEQAAGLEGTRKMVNETREELDGRLSSTRDELNGSIARTHDELVALQKRGDRDYVEFQLLKSKQFQRVGPISLSLRKADTKRKRYDVELMIDDAKLQKKSVNLYEPVYVRVNDRPQPLELVVNQISKDQVQGYVSVSKYKLSELNGPAGAPQRERLAAANQ